MTPEIHHLGAKDYVTGSCHLVQTRPGSSGGVNILVDCGKAYGNDPEIAFDRFPVSPGDIDYLFLTHAHIDHIGRVPDPDQPDACDLLVLESTYGDRNHTGRKNRIDALNKMLRQLPAPKGAGLNRKIRDRNY